MFWLVCLSAYLLIFLAVRVAIGVDDDRLAELHWGRQRRAQRQASWDSWWADHGYQVRRAVLKREQRHHA